MDQSNDNRRTENRSDYSLVLLMNPVHVISGELSVSISSTKKKTIKKNRAVNQKYIEFMNISDSSLRHFFIDVR